MGMPVTVAMGNAYYVFFVPMVIATHMPMPIVTGMPVTMCTGTSTIGKHASGWQGRLYNIHLNRRSNLCDQQVCISEGTQTPAYNYQLLPGTAKLVNNCQNGGIRK